MFKKKWRFYTHREQRILISGGMIIIFFVFYSWIWQPLTQRVTNLLQQRKQQQTLVQWLNHAVPRLYLLKAQGYSSTIENHVNLLSTVEVTAQKAQLDSFITQIEMTQTPFLQLSLQAAPFDRIVDWLSHLQTEQHIAVKSAHFQRATQIGTVNAQLTLQTIGVE